MVPRLWEFPGTLPWGDPDLVTHVETVSLCLSQLVATCLATSCGDHLCPWLPALQGARPHAFQNPLHVLAQPQPVSVASSQEPDCPILPSLQRRCPQRLGVCEPEIQVSSLNSWTQAVKLQRGGHGGQDVGEASQPGPGPAWGCQLSLARLQCCLTGPPGLPALHGGPGSGNCAAPRRLQKGALWPRSVGRGGGDTPGDQTGSCTSSFIVVTGGYDPCGAPWHLPALCSVRFSQPLPSQC